MKEYFKKKNNFIFAILGCIYGILFALGKLVTALGKIPFGSRNTLLTVLAYAMAFGVATFLLRGLVLPWIGKGVRWVDRKIQGVFWGELHFYHFLLVILVCWIPLLLICWPGIFSYDTQMQYAQAMDLSTLDDHHPVLHTLFLGACMRLGDALFHSANGGMLVYSVLQMLMNGFMLSIALSYTNREVKSPMLTLLGTGFICLFPLHGMLAICVTKDAMFSPLFLMIVLCLVELDRKREGFFENWRYPLCFLLVSTLAMLLRVNMLYAYFAGILVLLLIYRKMWKKSLPLLLAPIVLFFLIRSGLNCALQVEKSNAPDAYSLIFQCFAGVYEYTEVEGCGELTESEKGLLYYLIKDEGLRSMDPQIADPVNYSCNPFVFNENKAAYLKLWLKWAFKYPSQYLNVVINLTYDYWYPGLKTPRVDSENPIPMLELHCNPPVYFESKWQAAWEFLYDLVENFSYQKIPVLRCLFMNASYIWFLLYICAEAIYQKRGGVLRWMVLPLMFFGTDLLGPVALFRYLYPLVLTAPLLFAQLWRDISEK